MTRGPFRHRALVAGGVAALALTGLIASATAQPDSVRLRGGGSTFAAPLFEAWIDAFERKHPAIEVGYDVVGSGEGINRFLTGSLDFAATDAPLSAEQEAGVGGGVTHLPVTAGMIVVAYHLPDDLEGELRLPRDVYADIFAGRITKWDDPRLAAANPHLGLAGGGVVGVGREWRRGRHPPRLAGQRHARARPRRRRRQHPARLRHHRLRRIRLRLAPRPAARDRRERRGPVRAAHGGERPGRHRRFAAA